MYYAYVLIGEYPLWFRPRVRGHLCGPCFFVRIDICESEPVFMLMGLILKEGT